MFKLIYRIFVNIFYKYFDASQRYKNVRAVEICINIPDKFRSEYSNFIFVPPSLFIRECCYSSYYRDPLIISKLGFSRWRLYRDFVFRKKQLFELPLTCDYIFSKKASFRLFWQNKTIKIYINNGIRSISGFQAEPLRRRHFSHALLTVPILDVGNLYIEESISSGTIISEVDFINNNIYIKSLSDDIVKLIKIANLKSVAIQSFLFTHALIDVFPHDNKQSVLVGNSHGDLQLHNILWDKLFNRFVFIDWDNSGENLLLWDSYFLFTSILNKRAIIHNKSLSAKVSLMASILFDFLAHQFSLSNDDLFFQKKLCEKLLFKKYPHLTSSILKV
jgi:hypothetical protein